MLQGNRSFNQCARSHATEVRRSKRSSSNRQWKSMPPRDRSRSSCHRNISRRPPSARDQSSPSRANTALNKGKMLAQLKRRIANKLLVPIFTGCSHHAERNSHNALKRFSPKPERARMHSCSLCCLPLPAVLWQDNVLSLVADCFIITWLFCSRSLSPKFHRRAFRLLDYDIMLGW